LLDKPKYDSDKPRMRWLKLADGQSVKIRFIEELDEESANYAESRGLSLVVREHTNPKRLPSQGGRHNGGRGS